MALDKLKPRMSCTIDREAILASFQMDEKLSGNVLGSIVHKAIQRWLFPGDPGLSALLEMETYNAGLVSDEQRQAD